VGLYGTTSSRSFGPIISYEFCLFFLARSISMLGSGMTPVALAFAVLELTDSSVFLGIVLAAEMIPLLALVIVAGGIADRVRRDVLLVITNIGSGLTHAGMAWVVLTKQPSGILVPLAFATGCCHAFAAPALRGIVTQLVPRESLQRANVLVAIARNVTRILGPSVAGIIIAITSGGWVIACDAATFGIAAAFLAPLSLPAALSKAQSTSLLSDLVKGWAYFRSQPWIWCTTGAFAVFNAVQAGAWNVLGPTIVRDSIGSTGWGLALSARVAGLLFASLVMMAVTIRRPMPSGLIGMTFAALPLIMLGSGTNALWLAITSLIAGAGSAYFGIVWDTARQTKVPEHLLSRVAAYDEFGSYIAIPIGQLSAAPLASCLGVSLVVSGGGALIAIVMFGPLLLRAIRSLELP
jgi:MFS family permease